MNSETEADIDPNVIAVGDIAIWRKGGEPPVRAKVTHLPKALAEAGYGGTANLPNEYIEGVRVDEDDKPTGPKHDITCMLPSELTKVGP